MGDYLVIARKWRPQLFEELAGQAHVVRTLQNAITANRLAHAFLFAGPRGVGKTSAARILAKAVNCLQGPTPRPCNECSSCLEIAEGNSLDVLEIDGASRTKVENARELIENVRYLPSKGRYKVYIIDEVHMLSQSAFNALLKTLEEPPPHVIFIFATTEPHKIPLTIHSRCQRFDFRRIPLMVISERLREIADAEGVKIDEDALMLICREAQGSMRDAQSLLDQAISYAGERVTKGDILSILGVADRKVVLDLAAAILRRDPKGALSIVDEVYRQGYDLGEFSRGLLSHIRDLVVVKISSGQNAPLDLTEEEVGELMDQAGGVSIEELQRLFQVMLRCEELINRTPFPKLVLEMTVVEMARRDVLLPLEEILTRVERLQQVLPQRVLPPLPGAERTSGKAGSEEVTSRREEGVKEEDEKRWMGFVSFVRSENPVIASFLMQGRLLAIDNSQLEIGFLKGSFTLDRISDKETLEALHGLATRHFQRQMVVKVTTMDKAEPPSTKHEVSYPAETDRIRHLKKEAVGNPLIQEAMEIFQGKIVEVKVKEGS